MKVPVRWRKSSRSGQGTNCVEVGHPLGIVRDSKNAATLTVDVRSLLAAVKDDKLTR